MPILSEDIYQNRFESLDEVETWAERTNDELVRLPILGLIENHAKFSDDEYFGVGDTLLRFNARGIRSFCSIIGFRFDQLTKLETPDLATQVINDLLGQTEIQEKVAQHEFVYDQNTGVIVGVVSKSYVTYHNKQFLNDIAASLTSKADLFDDKGGFQFVEGYAVNTEMTLRFKCDAYHGEVKGRGGDGPDRTVIGVELHNSMEGSSSVRINYFLRRLICANGMMVPAATAINKVNHSGKSESFEVRLKKCLGEVVRKLGELPNLISNLGDVAFDPMKIAANTDFAKLVFDVIPATKQTIADADKISLQLPSNIDKEERRRLQLANDTEIIRRIPHHFAGEDSKRVFQTTFRNSATAFDLINVFTEHAKTEPRVSDRLEIERKAGVLAKFISDNKKKL